MSRRNLFPYSVKKTGEGIVKYGASKIVSPQATAWFACAVTQDPDKRINDSGLRIMTSFGIDGVGPLRCGHHNYLKVCS